MKSVWFHPDADAEMTEAAQYYEERTPGLGLTFLDAVETAAGKVLLEPEAYGLVGQEIRQKLLDRFLTVCSMLSTAIAFESWPLHITNAGLDIGDHDCDRCDTPTRLRARIFTKPRLPGTRRTRQQTIRMIAMRWGQCNQSYPSYRCPHQFAHIEYRYDSCHSM